MAAEAHSSLALTTFYNGRKKYRLQFNNNQIFWDNARPPYAQHVLPIENVIAVQCNYPKTNSTKNCNSDPKQFTIYYAKRTKKSIWRDKCVTLNHSDTTQVSSWVNTLQRHLDTFSHRPKRLLLFVNPYGGKKRAPKIYKKFAKPLFDIAGIDVTVITSQKQNQIRNIVIHHSLDIFDSVGCVGGDGTVSELLNGLVLRECRVQGIDPDDAKQKLPKPTVAVGIIPGGSTDTTAYCLHGTTDVITAVLHIILGDTRGLDLVSVRDENRLLQLYADVVSYGYLGDIIYYSEDLRWMGSSRYEYIGFKKIVANQGYRGEISILADETDSIMDCKCYENCQKCLQKRSQEDDDTNVEHKWTTIQGKFFLICGANVSCAGERNPNGLAPYCHIGDGYLHLIVIRHTSFFNSLRTLHRFTRSTFSIDDLEHVEIFRAKEFRFRAEGIPGRWNCDGEVLLHTDIRTKVHCQLLTVFSRGMLNPEDIEKGCCGT